MGEFRRASRKIAGSAGLPRQRFHARAEARNDLPAKVYFDCRAMPAP
jgi:hypothetical protein